MEIIVFGIDYDGTITAAPELFRKIIEFIRNERHEIWIVTSRTEGDYDSLLQEFANIVDRVIFTNQQAKADIADVDIWIDNMPITITHHFENGKFIPGKNIKE